MDYDDLVDQFIVNDKEDVEAEEIKENEEEKSAVGEENNLNNKDSIPSDNSELIKIHLKTLIRSRHSSLRIAQLDRIRERNRFFESKKKEIYSSSSSPPSSSPSNHQNSDKRRRILGTFNSEKVANSEDDEIITSCRSSNELIPCRLELDHDGYKLSDVFLLPPTSETEILNLISTQLCQDYDLPLETFQPAISKCIKDQLEEWFVFQGALDGMKDTLPFEEIGPVPLRLDIIVGLHRLEDHLEVNLDPSSSNTEGMKKFVQDLRTPDESILSEKEYSAFKPLILHNLLEQLMLWRKAIVFGGYHRDPRSNNLKFHDGDVAVLLNDSSSTVPLPSVRRHFADTNTFTPILSTLTLEDLDKIESGRERESRRRKRTGMIVSALSSNSSTTGRRAGGGGGTGVGSVTTVIANNLTGTVRSPPRTLPTPTSYRGSLHRIQPNNPISNINNTSDDEGSIGASKKRGRKSKY